MIPHNPNPLHLAAQAERLAKGHAGGKLNLIFSGITAVSMGAMALKMFADLFREKRERDHERHHHR